MKAGASLALLVLVAGLVAAGCSSGEPEKTSEPTASEPAGSSRDATGGQWGAYPADTSLDEAEVVEAYVRALDERDGARFCSVVAPWISGRFDLGGTDPDSSFSRPMRCPELVAGFIGYIEDCCPPKFVGATISEVGQPDRRGDLVGLPVTVALSLEESTRGSYEEPLDDMVWVTRDSGAWRIAKLSKVAAAASIGLGSDADLTTPPNVAAERAAFATEVVAADRRRRTREGAYRAVQDRAACQGASRYSDGPRDVVDYRHPAPPSPTPQSPAADIAAFETASADGGICALFELAGEIRTGTTFEFAIESPEFEWGRSGFSQGFEIELRADGRARVSSGLDDDRRSISVPAIVGLDGRRLMLEVDGRSFAAGRPFPGSVAPARPLRRFDFRAAVTVVLSEKRHLHDDLGPGPPEGVQRYSYPLK